MSTPLVVIIPYPGPYPVVGPDCNMPIIKEYSKFNMRIAGWQKHCKRFCKKKWEVNYEYAVPDNVRAPDGNICTAHLPDF